MSIGSIRSIRIRRRLWKSSWSSSFLVRAPSCRKGMWRQRRRGEEDRVFSYQVSVSSSKKRAGPTPGHYRGSSPERLTPEFFLLPDARLGEFDGFGSAVWSG